MGFVNEYASEEDIAKYHLDEIYKQYNSNPEMKWTIDRERDIFMMLGARLHTEGMLDAARYLISRQGKLTEHTLFFNFDKETRTIYWRYGRIGKPHAFKSEEERKEWESTLSDLKEALRTYKATGASKNPFNDFENVVCVDF